MKLFRILFGWLANRWVFSVLGLLLLALLIWFVGPLIAIGGWEPLAGSEARLVAILVVLVLWAVKTIWGILRGAQNNAQVVNALSSAPADDDKASAEEVELLQRRFREALSLLKKAKLGGRGRRRRLYQLPWYLMIGPPGAGKTTALKNSGLKFPLADRFGKDAVRGVGGTRNCDWWFTEEAVLLDTAGRYTTQDSDQTVDSAAWGGFLQLLRKYRRRRPIDGVLVAISLTDLVAEDGMETRQHHALAVRKRLQELQEQLQVRVPVYVVFTKCDLMSGFIEFFDDLGRDEREQVWGVTFPIAASEKPEKVIEAFGPQLDALLERLDSRLPGRLNQERDLHRRGMMLGFLQQMASLKAPLQQFLNDAFYPSRYEDSSLIRGVYFSSGTQEGTPIDRILSSISTTFGLDRQAMPAFSGPGRSYFLTRLLREVVFQEADLVGDRSFLARYGNWITRGVHAASAAALLALVGVWLLSYSQNESYIADVSDKVAQYKQVTGDLDIENDSLLDVLPPLDMLGDIPDVYNNRGALPTLTMGFGLYQGKKLGQAATSAYRRALNAAMVPRMRNRLHIRIRQSADQTEALYQALKVYLMLGYPEHLDRELARDWFTVDWALRFPGPTNEAVRNRLQTHLEALLEGDLSPPELDAALVANARETLARLPLAERVYAEVKRAADQANMVEWRPTDKVKDVARYFTRKSGAPMTSGMQGLFTYKGYTSEFLKRVPDFAERAANETWVIGSANKESLDDADVTAVTNAVLELYYYDYIRQWQAYLLDVDVIPFRSFAEATEVSKVLSDIDSPIKGFLAAIAEETRLARLPGDIGGDGDGLIGDLIKKFQEAGVEDPANRVNRKFEDLRRVISASKDGAAPPIDKTLALVNELYNHLIEIRNLGSSSDGVSVLVRLRQEAGRSPSPLSHWLRTLARQSERVVGDSVRRRLGDIWASDIAPFCRTALNNRYPLARGSREDANLGDFAQYFGPNGLVDKFVKSELKPFVDTSVRPWREIGKGGGKLNLAEDSLRAIEGAARIKEAFFAGGAEPSAKFALKPLELDRSARQVQLELGGQRLTYRHGPTRLGNMQWPPPDGLMVARLEFTPLGGSTAGTSLTAEGPWALFRLLDKGRLRKVSNSVDRFRVSFEVDGLTAIFELKAASVANPFWLAGMEGLRCLEKL